MKSLLIACLIFTLSTPLLAKELIGIVGGKKIYIEDIEDKTINDLRKQLYSKAQEKFMFTALKRLQKKHKGWGKIKTPKISDKLARSFYRSNQLQGRGTYQDLKPQIVKYLKEQAKDNQRIAYYKEAVKKKWVKESLNQPGDFITKVPLKSAYTWKGSKNPKVVFLEFSDYQCPFCNRSQATVTALRKRYKTTVLFAYRHYPLPFHTEADEAAVAAECAREQGKFEEMHSLLFKNPRAQFPKDLLRHAKKIGVKSQSKFAKCLKKDKYRGRLNQDLADAQAVGISGTPSFVIGKYDKRTKTVRGEVVSGALPEAQLAALIQKYLK